MSIKPYNSLSQYSNYYQDKIGYISPPKPSLNGGLYTGEKFHDNAEYKNFPAKPDAVYLHKENLKSANPPPNVSFQFPDNFRPGNNLPDSIAFGLNRFKNENSIICTHYKPQENIHCKTTENCESIECKNKMYNKGFSKHYYL